VIYKELLRRESLGKPIRVGAYGAGWMGSGFAAQMTQVPGMELVILSDDNVAAARDAFVNAGISADDIVEENSPGAAEDAVRSGKRVITADLTLVAQIASVDIVTDVTPSPSIGAEMAYTAIKHGKDVVLINIEADVTVGRILKRLAHQAGVLYSVSSGD
jgi:predicted homoserine dehydrogenase-like protein